MFRVPSDVFHSLVNHCPRKQQQRNLNMCIGMLLVCSCKNSELCGHWDVQMSELRRVPSRGVRADLICLQSTGPVSLNKQTNIQLSLLSVTVLQQPTLQEQLLPKLAAQHNGAKSHWNHRMRTMQPAGQ